MRDDQACLLALVHFTFMNVPQAIHKYLFRKQEKLHHARWMTKANGYLRTLNFHLFELTMTNSQKAALKSICQFILNVYAPMYFSIYTRPSAVEGPALVLLNRDLMKSTQPQIVKHTYHVMLFEACKNLAVTKNRCFLLPLRKSPCAN